MVCSQRSMSLTIPLSSPMTRCCRAAPFSICLNCLMEGTGKTRLFPGITKEAAEFPFVIDPCHRDLLHSIDALDVDTHLNLFGRNGLAVEHAHPGDRRNIRLVFGGNFVFR